jgi:hypothetical protein
LRCIACLDPWNSFANYDREKLIELAQICDVDFSQYDHDRLPQQLDNFISDVRADPSFANCTDLGELAIKMVQTERHTTFPLKGTQKFNFLLAPCLISLYMLSKLGVVIEDMEVDNANATSHH